MPLLRRLPRCCLWVICRRIATVDGYPAAYEHRHAVTFARLSWGRQGSDSEQGADEPTQEKYFLHEVVFLLKKRFDVRKKCCRIESTQSMESALCMYLNV